MLKIEVKKMDKALLKCKSVEKINDQLYCLKEIESVNRYLIVGTTHALLFDAGYGYLDFKEQIKEITDLPVYVVNSHGHPDHGLGDYLFKNVYIHVNDYYQLLAFDNDSSAKLHTIKYRYKKITDIRIRMAIVPNMIRATNKTMIKMKNSMIEFGLTSTIFP